MKGNAATIQMANLGELFRKPAVDIFLSSASMGIS